MRRALVGDRCGASKKNDWVPSCDSSAVASASGCTARCCYCSPDTVSGLSYRDLLTAKDLRRILRSFGCVEMRQRGSHLRVEYGLASRPSRCTHAGEDIRPGLLRRIERDLEPCLGKGRLKSREDRLCRLRTRRIGLLDCVGARGDRCHTQDRIDDEARRRIREALELSLATMHVTPRSSIA